MKSNRNQTFKIFKILIDNKIPFKLEWKNDNYHSALVTTVSIIVPHGGFFRSPSFPAKNLAFPLFLTTIKHNFGLNLIVLHLLFYFYKYEEKQSIYLYDGSIVANAFSICGISFSFTAVSCPSPTPSRYMISFSGYALFSLK